MDKQRRNKDIEEFKYLIDSRNLTSAEKKEEREALLRARELRFRNRTDNEVKTAKLMQLKYKMEDYVSDFTCSGPYFTEFLKSYIDTLYDKRKNFASDINVKPLVISHILNGHREPQDTFFLRLIHHSQQTFRSLCEFNWDLWPKVYFQDKVCLMKASSKEWEKTEGRKLRGKEIKVSE